MTTTLRSRLLVSAAASVVALALAPLFAPGCTVNDTGATAWKPAGPPTLAVADPADGACVVMRADAGWTVSVSIAINQYWLMRPPGFCGTFPQCGYAVAFVDDQRVAEASALVIDVPFGGLATPSGEHRIRVELHDDADQPARGGDGKPLAIEVTVNALEPGGSCSGPADGGQDAAIDAPEDVASDGPEDGAADGGDAAEADAALDAAAEADASQDGAADAMDAADSPIEASAEDAADGGEAGDAELPDASLPD